MHWTGVTCVPRLCAALGRCLFPPRSPKSDGCGMEARHEGGGLQVHGEPLLPSGLAADPLGLPAPSPVLSSSTAGEGAGY